MGSIRWCKSEEGLKPWIIVSKARFGGEKTMLGFWVLRVDIGPEPIFLDASAHFQSLDLLLSTY